MPKLLKTEDYQGRRFNMLSFVRIESIKGKKTLMCRCDCGKLTACNPHELIHNKKKSCGCAKRENCIKRSTKHGLAKHPLVFVRQQMIARCYNPLHPRYKDYGGRGITVCAEWKNNFILFYNWCVQNGWQPGLEIDRRDNNGNYEQENCRFVTQDVNARNTRRVRMIAYKGKTQTLAEWSRELGLNYGTLRNRIHRRKLTPEELLSPNAAPSITEKIPNKTP